jgi:hypothetical protein
MESYEHAVQLALMVVNLDESIYKTMIRSGLKKYINTEYQNIIKSNNKQEINKFILASKILLNDLHTIPVNHCSNISCQNNQMINKCDSSVNYLTPVYHSALIDSNNVVNSNVTKYIDGFNPNTWNPQISTMTQPLDTIGLYKTNNSTHFTKLTGYRPEAKIRINDNLQNIITHPIQDAKNTTYSQYSNANYYS